MAAARATFGPIDVAALSAEIQRYGTALCYEPGRRDEVGGINLAARGTSRALSARPGDAAAPSSSSPPCRAASQQNVLAYTVSKHALLGLARSLAMDFAADGRPRERRVPAPADTPMLRWAASLDPNPQSVIDACVAMHPIGRIARP